MFGKTVVFLLLGIVCCGSIKSERQYELLEGFQELAASTALMLPTVNVSSACFRQSQIVRQEARRYNLWALKILDATAKIPSGILSGNLNQFGDFDLCMSADDSSRYCLADFDIVSKHEKFKGIDDRMHGYRSMTNEIYDPGQRLPKLSSWRWGVCIPKECMASDLSKHLQETLSQQLGHLAQFKVRVDPDLCYTAERTSLGVGHFIAMLLFTLLAICIAQGTFQSNPANKSKLNQIYQCFSIQKNWGKLTSLEPEGDDIPIVHGTRALNALALLLSHKQMAYLFVPLVNSIRVGEKVNGAWSMIGRAAIIYTDSFILISGLLSALSLFKEVERSGKVNVRRNLISRYIRFTPNLLFLILTCTYVLDFFGSGPLWGQVVTKYSTLCKSKMWRNLLYIHNYFGFEEMCLTHTHQLGMDMQLYLLAPILTYILWRYPKVGVSVTVFVAALSSWLRYSVAMEHELTPIIYYGVSIQQLLKTARLSYILPTHRATVYCFGIMLAFAIRRGYDRWTLSTRVATVGWSFASAAAFLALFGPSHMAYKGYEYSPYEAAMYSAWSPILWSFFLVWSAIACWSNKGGFLNDLLSWRYFIIFSRISYAFYLVQFPVFFYNVGKAKHSEYYTGFMNVCNIPELIVIIGLSVLLTLFVDLPFQNLKKTFMPAVKEVTPYTVVNEQDKKDTVVVRKTYHG